MLTDKVIISFIHFQFCWLPVKADSKYSNSGIQVQMAKRAFVYPEMSHLTIEVTIQLLNLPIMSPGLLLINIRLS